MNDDLNWLAMQYVLGELTPTERESFEEQLLTNTAACEAVAAAAHLQHGLKLALAQPSVRTQAATIPAIRSRFAIAGLALSVATAFVAVGFWRSVLSDPNAIELVASWRAGMESTEIDADETTEELLDVDGDMDVPDWLVAGVELESPTTADQVKEN